MGIRRRRSLDRSKNTTGSSSNNTNSGGISDTLVQQAYKERKAMATTVTAKERPEPHHGAKYKIQKSDRRPDNFSLRYFGETGGNMG
jgi:hypothetical protein